MRRGPPMPWPRSSRRGRPRPTPPSRLPSTPDARPSRARRTGSPPPALSRWRRRRSVVISGAGHDDRSGDVAANLAAALAAKGSRVILLDADPDGRHVTTVLGLDDRAGLGELLTSAGERPPVADIAVPQSRHLS